MQSQSVSQSQSQSKFMEVHYGAAAQQRRVSDNNRQMVVYNGGGGGGTFTPHVSIEEVHDDPQPPYQADQDGRHFTEFPSLLRQSFRQLESAEETLRAQVVGQLQHAQAQMTQLRAEITILRNENLSLQGEKESQLKRHEGEIAQLQGEIGKVRKDRTSWRDQTMQLSEQLAVEKGRMSQMSATIASLEKEQERLRRMRENREAAIAHLEEQKKAAEEKVKQLKTACEQQQNQLKKMESYNKQFQLKINTLNGELGQKTLLVTSMKEEYEKESAAQKSTIMEQKEAIENLEQQKKSLSETVEQLKADHELTLQNTKKELEDKIGELRNEAESRSKAIFKITGDRDRVNSELKDLQTRVDSQLDVIKNLKAECGSREEKASELELQLNQANVLREQVFEKHQEISQIYSSLRCLPQKEESSPAQLMPVTDSKHAICDKRDEGGGRLTTSTSTSVQITMASMMKTTTNNWTTGNGMSNGNGKITLDAKSFNTLLSDIFSEIQSLREGITTKNNGEKRKLSPRSSFDDADEASMSKHLKLLHEFATNRSTRSTSASNIDNNIPTKHGNTNPTVVVEKLSPNFHQRIPPSVINNKRGGGSGKSNGRL